MILQSVSVRDEALVRARLTTRQPAGLLASASHALVLDWVGGCLLLSAGRCGLRTQQSERPPIVWSHAFSHSYTHEFDTVELVLTLEVFPFRIWADLSVFFLLPIYMQLD